MKKTLGIGAAVGVLGLLLWMGTALGFSSISVDAGYIGNLTILGTCTGPGCGGGGGSGVIADAGNFIAVSIDGGYLEIDNPQNPYQSFPCDGGNQYCNIANNYSWMGTNLVLHNPSPQISFFNTAMNSGEGLYLLDAGIMFNMYENNSGLLEFNYILSDGLTVESTCLMDFYGGTFNCLNNLSAAQLLAYNRVDVNTSPNQGVTPAFPETYQFTLQAGVDPKLDGGYVAAFLYGQAPAPVPDQPLHTLYIGANYEQYYAAGWKDIDFQNTGYMVDWPPIEGTMVSDAGVVQTMYVVNNEDIYGPLRVDAGIETGTTTKVCVGNNNSASTYVGMGIGPCLAGGFNNATQLFEANGTNLIIGFGMSGTQTIYGGGQIAANLGTISGHTTLQAPATLEVGSGSFFTSMGAGTCTLSSGTCNAVVLGATGNSSCYCGIQGTYARDAGSVTCSAQADAGSATCYCYYATLVADPAPAPVGIHCDN